jgi:hypothetical protein
MKTSHQILHERITSDDAYKEQHAPRVSRASCRMHTAINQSRTEQWRRHSHVQRASTQSILKTGPGIAQPRFLTPTSRNRHDSTQYCQHWNTFVKTANLPSKGSTILTYTIIYEANCQHTPQAWFYKLGYTKFVKIFGSCFIIRYTTRLNRYEHS